MSHTTTVNAIEISDIRALESAIADLKAIGIDCSLQRNVKPRAYSAGQMPTAPYALVFGSSRYDIGFYQEGPNKSYVPKCDFWDGSIERHLGVPQEDGVPADQCRLGKLYHAYSTNAVCNAATRAGHAIRKTRNAKGETVITVTGA